MSMTISRRSTVTGTVNTMTVNISNLALLQWQQGEIALAMVDPPLSAADVLFLEHGITPEEHEAHSVV